MTTLRPSRATDGDALVDLWRRAVDATHDFLSAEDRQAIDAEVAGFLPQAPLVVAADDQDRPQGFMLIDGSHMEALFIDPDVRGTGIGRQLLLHALALHPQLSTDVNAQNAQAVGFIGAWASPKPAARRWIRRAVRIPSSTCAIKADWRPERRPFPDQATASNADE